jgi:DNA anti-recombination protein RmuC
LETQLEDAYREAQNNSRLLDDRAEEIRKLESRLSKETHSTENRITETVREVERMEEELKICQEAEAKWKRECKEAKTALDAAKKENGEWGGRIGRREERWTEKIVPKW